MKSVFHPAICLFLLLAGFVAGPAALLAQEEYKSLTPAPSLYMLPTDPPDVQRAKKDKIRNVDTQIREVLSGKVTLTEKQTIVDAWYVNYKFPLMTLTTPEAIANLSAERTSFLKSLQFATSVEGHRYVVDIALREMGKIALDAGFHPAVRYNAMMIIAELNTTETLRSGNTAPAEGHLPSLQFMLKQLEDEKQAELVRVGALIGVVRHAQLDHFNYLAKTPADRRIPNKDWSTMKNLLLGLVRNRTPAAGRDPRAHDWIRRRAFEGIGWMAAGRPEPELVREIAACLTDPKESRGVRREAAFAVGNAIYTGPVTVKPRELAIGIARYLHDAALEDVEFLESSRAASAEQNELYNGSTADVLPTGDYALSTTRAVDPYAYRLDPLRRRLQYEVGCCLWGLIGSREKKKSGREPVFGLVALANVKGQNEKEAKLNPADRKFVDELSEILAQFAVVATDEKNLFTETDPYIAQMKTLAGELLTKTGAGVLDEAEGEPDPKKPAAAAVDENKSSPAAAPKKPEAAAPDDAAF